MSQFTFTEGAGGDYTLEGQVMEKLWVGTHSFQVQSRLGVFNAESERGDQGLFGSVDSEIMTITILDPCE